MAKACAETEEAMTAHVAAKGHETETAQEEIQDLAARLAYVCFATFRATQLHGLCSFGRQTERHIAVDMMPESAPSR